MLLKARREGEEEAREAWFFLFGIIHIELRYGSGNGTAELMELVNALDAFVQGSPVGQYEERLALLTMFSRSCRQRKQRGYDEVSKALGNLARYYGQFQPAIDDRVAADLKPLEKELADFVKLAKWEDRGFYAMKASAEKAHSQLCKIIRKAKDALGTPASACLRVLAGDIGIDAADKDKDKDKDIASKSKGKDKEKHGSAKATHGTTSKTMQLLASLRGTPPVSVDVPPSSPSSVHLRPAESNLLVGIVEVVLLKWRRSEPTTLTRGDPPSFGLSVSHSRHALRSFARSLVRQGKYSKRIHDIAGTFQRMVKSKEDAIEGICDAVSQADGLSTAALEQAIALKNDVSKGAKSRKKKALADFFKALEACGISKLQTAVGVNDRDPRRWMTVDFEGVSDSSYYYESIARLNRLREVSQQPHQDVQAREIHMANNMMTHAVHRVQETRWVFISAEVRSNALTLSLHAICSFSRSAICTAASSVAFLEGVTLAIGSAPPPATFAAIQEAAGCFLNEASRCCEWLEGCAGVPGTSNPRVADLSRFLEAWTPAVERLRAGLAAARPPALEGVDWTSPEMAAEVSIHLRAGSEATRSPAHGHPSLPARAPPF